MPFSSLLILWLSFWLPFAPSFRCLRDPLWCPKSSLGLSLRLWGALGALFGTSRTLFGYLELIWSSFECLLVSSDPPLPPKNDKNRRNYRCFWRVPKVALGMPFSSLLILWLSFWLTLVPSWSATGLLLDCSWIAVGLPLDCCCCCCCCCRCCCWIILVLLLDCCWVVLGLLLNCYWIAAG